MRKINSTTPDVQHFQRAVVIGRMEPPHLGHFNLIEQALAQADQVNIVLGSAFHAPTVRNPFTWQERAAMLKLMFEADWNRIQILPVRDYYNGARWADEVRGLVGGTKESTVLLGHRKDYTSEYLEWFPEWTLEDVNPPLALNATDIRNVYFETKRMPAALAVLAPRLHPDVVAYLEGWARLPTYANLMEEHAKVQGEMLKWASAPYAVNHVTADAILECNDQIALIRRKHSPGKGLLALPGGFVNNNETTLEASLRELKEETKIGLFLAQLRRALVASNVFDYPLRSSRGRVITHAFHFKLELDHCPDLTGSDDADWAGWTQKAELSKLEDQFHDDHFHILDHFLHLT